uniref:Uncharacterized protein n=1 Tax=Geospiza parvula TaxID=87175 RepID=A0A8U8ATM5_GEOPR
MWPENSVAGFFYPYQEKKRDTLVGSVGVWNLRLSKNIAVLMIYLCTCLSTSWRGKFLGDEPQSQNCILFDNFHLELNCYFTLILLFLLHAQIEVA